MHEDFKATVQELARQLIMKGPEEDLVDEVRKRLGEWLVTHIKGQDIKLGTYLASHALRAN